jgi:hypothetical protein
MKTEITLLDAFLFVSPEVFVLVLSKIGASNLSLMLLLCSIVTIFVKTRAYRNYLCKCLQCTLKETCLLFFEKFYYCGMMVE